MGKSDTQRQVQFLRILVVEAMAHLEVDEDDDEDERDPEEAINKLKIVETKLRDLERTVSTAIARTAPTLPMAGAGLSHSARQYLASEFQDHDPEAAESNFEMQAQPGARARSRSIHEQSIDFHNSPKVAAILEQCGSWEFDACDLAETDGKSTQICILGSYLLQYRGHMISALKFKGWVQDDTAFTQVYIGFLGSLDTIYKSDTEVFYHNASHATDVMATVDLFMRFTHLQQKTSLLDHFMALTAAAVHDLGHPGTNAIFHKKTMSDLTIRYNDKSILENMHSALAFEIMKKDEFNWMRMLTAQGDQDYVRKGIIHMVLSTDMKKHTKQMIKFKEYMDEELAPAIEGEKRGMEGEKETAAEKQRALDRKHDLLASVIHAADLSNPAKATEIALKWTKRLALEFFRQGDQERMLGLEISPMCSRREGRLTVPEGQIGFISFVLSPMYRPLAELIDEYGTATKQLEDNCKFWEEKKAASATFEDIFGCSCD